MAKKISLEKYFEYRDLFESRFKPNELGSCKLSTMKSGIINFPLFLAIYGHDKHIRLHSNTYGVDREKRYSIPFKSHAIGTKITILNKDSEGKFKKWPDMFYKLLEQLPEKF